MGSVNWLWLNTLLG